ESVNAAAGWYCRRQLVGRDANAGPAVGRAKISPVGEILPDASAVGAHAEERWDHLVHSQRLRPPFVQAPRCQYGGRERCIGKALSQRRNRLHEKGALRRYWSVRKDGRRTSEGDGVARELG